MEYRPLVCTMAGHLDFDLLRSLVAAVETESVTAAAAKLGLTQPTVSKHIAVLETRYGTRLLHRDGRGVRATALSLRFAERARAILEQAAALEGEAAHGQTERVVCVALPPTVADLAVVPLVTTVRARDPALRLVVTEGFSTYAADWVRQGTAQAGVVYATPDLHGLSVMASFSDAVQFVFPAQDNLLQLGRVDRATLEAMDFVLPGRPHGMRLLVDSMCVQFGLTLRVPYEMASLGTIRQLVLAGRAATVLPFNVVAADVQAGRMLLGRAEEVALVRNLSVVSAAARPRTAEVRGVMDDLCAVLERELAYTAQELRRMTASALRLAFA